MSSKAYQSQIDGLRALSVLVIIFFHLKVKAFAGGFIGVDIFFVISGYLITQIIVSNLDAGKFTFKDFYIRRSTRILPALVATLLVVYPLAMYLQQPQGLIHTAQETIYSLLSVSNFFFWAETSYWAPSAEKFVLLHTWSLGVEEQFYLIYPLLLVACHRMAGNRGVIGLLIALFVVGTVASEMVLKTDRQAAFYFTPLRFYEFALGGLAATLADRNPLQKFPGISGIATLFGLTLILYGSVEFNGVWMALPGIAILPPLFGALLVLLAGPSHSAKILLMNPLMSWLGKISYSLYLIHWPLVVFYRYYFGPNLSPLDQSVLFISILAAASLLNWSVERRFRLTSGRASTASGVSARAVLLGTLAVAIGIGAVSTLLILNKGWQSRMPEDAQALMKLDPQKDKRWQMKFLANTCKPKGEVFCGERKPGMTNIMLLGDSRGIDVYAALKVAYPAANIQVSYAIGCAPVFNPAFAYSRFYAACPELNEARLQAALNAPTEDIILLAQDLNGWRASAVRDTVKRLRQAGKTVYLLGQFQFLQKISPIEISIDLLRFHPESGIDSYILENPFKFDGAFADDIRAMGAVYLSNKAFFYDGGYHFTDRATGKLLTFDGKHLNKFGAEKFGAFLRNNYPLP